MEGLFGLSDWQWGGFSGLAIILMGHLIRQSYLKGDDTGSLHDKDQAWHLAAQSYALRRILLWVELMAALMAGAAIYLLVVLGR